MTRLKNWVMGILLKKYALGYAVEAWNFADGYKTQIQFCIGIVIVLMGIFNFMDFHTSLQVAGMVGGSAFATFMDKLRKHEGMILQAKTSIEKRRAQLAAQGE